MKAKKAKKLQESATALAAAIASGTDPILNKRQTASMIGVSVSTLDRMRKRKEFPPPIDVSGGRRIGWRLSVVQAWLASRPTR
jgi:predicted DNA-binding transcriptional regulator AlpA